MVSIFSEFIKTHIGKYFALWVRKSHLWAIGLASMWNMQRSTLKKNQSKLLKNETKFLKGIFNQFIGKSTSDKSLFHMCDKLTH